MAEKEEENNMKKLKSYEDSISYHFLAALAHAGKTHLYDEESKVFQVGLLNNPQREINNTTCAEAFVQTFKEHFLSNSLRAVEHEEDEGKRTTILEGHHNAVSEIVDVVSNHILENKANSNFHKLTELSLSIINNNVENTRDKYLGI